MLDILAPEDLVRLTGYVRPSKQAAWLAREGIRHRINGVGHVVVLRSDLESAKPRPRHPNLAAIRA